MKTAPATTAANATRRVPTRAGRDTSHHLASSRRLAHTTGPAARSRTLRPEVSSGHDLAIVRGAPATALAMNDEIVMIRASRPGKFLPRLGADHIESLSRNLLLPLRAPATPLITERVLQWFA